MSAADEGPGTRYNAADQLRDCAPDVLNGKALHPSVWDSILNTMGKWRVNIATPKGRARAARDMLARADALDNITRREESDGFDRGVALAVRIADDLREEIDAEKLANVEGL